jgi:uncharacterized phage infection (PIP) family protein YhgE
MLNQGRRSQRDSFDSIDQRLQQNDADMVNMETYIESKHAQLSELQQYLVREFAEMQQRREAEGRVAEVMGAELRLLLADVKQLLSCAVSEFRKVFAALMAEAMESCATKMAESDRELQLKNSQLVALKSKVAALKQQLANVPPSPHEATSPSKLPHPKSVSRSALFELQTLQTKQSGEGAEPAAFARCPKEGSELRVGNILFGQTAKEPLKVRSRAVGQSENKLLSKSSTTKQIGFEVQRVLREDYENQRLLIDHKRFVKEKIESFKSRNVVAMERGKRYEDGGRQY